MSPTAIIVSPVDPECRLSEKECASIQNRIEAAEEGDVIVVGVPVNIYHLVGGFWVLSEDLKDVLDSDNGGDKKPRHPAESTYTPPGCKTIDEGDEDDEGEDD